MPDHITPRERDLLLAIRSVLNIPEPAPSEDRQGYYDTLTERAAALRGALLYAASPGDLRTLDGVIKACRSFAAWPLKYKPSTEGE